MRQLYAYVANESTLYIFILTEYIQEKVLVT